MPLLSVQQLLQIIQINLFDDPLDKLQNPRLQKIEISYDFSLSDMAA